LNISHVNLNVKTKFLASSLSFGEGWGEVYTQCENIKLKSYNKGGIHSTLIKRQSSLAAGAELHSVTAHE
jgi:hypothetical protein